MSYVNPFRPVIEQTPGQPDPTSGDAADAAETAAVRIVANHDDRVEVMRTWTVTAPDWIPPYKKRAIAPTTVRAVWIDGVINRVAVTGPYRMKSGAVAEPKFEGDESHIGGTGDPDYRADWDRMTYAYPDHAGEGWTSYCREQFPDWIPAFIDANAPTI